jgi:hypothetical protein
VTAADAVMKPRRENGAALVNPMTSDVSRGSALISSSSQLKHDPEKHAFGPRPMGIGVPKRSCSKRQAKAQ